MKYAILKVGLHRIRFGRKPELPASLVEVILDRYEKN